MKGLVRYRVKIDGKNKNNKGEIRLRCAQATAELSRRSPSCREKADIQSSNQSTPHAFIIHYETIQHSSPAYRLPAGRAGRFIINIIRFGVLNLVMYVSLKPFSSFCLTCFWYSQFSLFRSDVFLLPYWLCQFIDFLTIFNKSFSIFFIG